jgi:hypothetical protein
MGASHDYADAPETCINFAEDIVLGSTVLIVVAQAARYPGFVHPICNTYIYNNEICVIMVNFKKPSLSVLLVRNILSYLRFLTVQIIVFYPI